MSVGGSDNDDDEDSSEAAQAQAKSVSPSTSQRQAENVPPAYGDELEEVKNLTTRELLLKLHG